MISLFASHARRRMAAVRADGDRGSLVLAMLVTLVATSVAALILPLLMNSTNAAKFDDRRTKQLAAAQSGVEAVLAQIRASSTTATSGPIPVPCATVLGTVLGSTNLRYKAEVKYYTTDPAVMTATQLVDNALTCLVGTTTGIVNGVLQTVGGGTAVVPTYARITAWGTDTPGTSWTGVSQRSVSATYVVKTTNSNIVGGLFRVNKLPTSKDLCLDAGSANPAANTPVTMQLCSAGSASQKWAYNATLTVSLVSTRTTDTSGAITSDGMCIDGGPLISGKEQSGTALRVQPCGTVTTLNQQRWSMNDNAGMQGTDTGTSLNSLCWNVASPDSTGSQIVLGSACSGSNGYDNKASWQPEAAVGAGASGATYNELVNYAQFGRCLDVTDQNVSSAYLIAWPCKQNPDPTKVAWNQRWALPTITNGSGSGQITTTVNGTTYCLTSPMTADAKKYVRVNPCPAAATPETTWKVRTKATTYAASYQIEDMSGGTAAPGLCLQPTDPNAADPDLFDKGTGISKIVVQPCTANTLQKWNAPPNVDAPSVRDQTEN